MNAFGWRSDAEDKSRSAVDVLKRQSEFRAGIFRIDRLVRIVTRLSPSKFLNASHAISGDLAFQFDLSSLRDYWARAATNCRKDTDFSKLIAWKRLRDKAGANHLAK